MKRMTLIAVALCLIMIATVGVGAVAARQGVPQSGKVMQFDVKYEGTVKGTIIVNTNAWTYVVNARGLEPGTYWLKCEELPGIIATATATANGNLHMQGKLNTAPNVKTTSPLFVLGTGNPPLGAGELYLDAKECAGGWTSSSFFGTLKDSSGTGVGGQVVEFYTYDPSTMELQYPGEPAGTATTKSDGTFCKVFFGGHKGYDIAAFVGGWTYPTAEDWNVENAYSCPVCK